jgi:KRAB domain-containing zinc finger protein
MMEHSRKPIDPGFTLVRIDCQYCDGILENSETPEAHMLKHKFECLYCDGVLKLGETISAHKQSHKSEFKFKCTQCDDQRKFYSDRELATHIRYQHIAIECGICKRKVNENNLNHHMAAYHPFQCSKCEEYFRTEKNLDYHFERIHAVHFLNKCIVCGKRFEFPNELKKHLLTHNKGYIYDCPVCEEKFKLEEQFSRHINYVHEKIFDCEVCQKSFGSLGSLREHQRTHSESLKCKICDLRFPTQKAAKQHIKAAHGNSLEVEVKKEEDNDIVMVEIKKEVVEY